MPPQKMCDDQLTTPIPHELKASIQRIAKEMERTPADLVRLILREYVEAHDAEKAPESAISQEG